MKRILFNDNWKVHQETDSHGIAMPVYEVTLPHDAMIHTKRSENVKNGSRKGYFENGVWEYTKEFEVPDDWKYKHIKLEFEGVYSNATVCINGSYAGQHPYGYTEFTVAADKFLKYGATNTIKVVVRTNDDSRWYTGAGIYRNVNLMVSELIHISNNGVQITTPEVSENKAVVSVKTKIMHDSLEPLVTVQVKNELFDADGSLAAASVSPLSISRGESQEVVQRMCIVNPKRWSVDSPMLYACKTTLFQDGKVKDVSETKFGIRSLNLDSVDGLRVNGEAVKLRGSCIHHDNGILGACAYKTAEFRKIKKLKENGFNAIRMSHHPASRTLLDACDEIGMLVMDETFDIWTLSKGSYDYAMNFEEWWERDVEAMVAKDFNHPSVIMYSIGNEIPDPETTAGAIWGHKIAAKIRSLDSTRYTVNCVNGNMLIAGRRNELMAKLSSQQPGEKANNPAEGQFDVNVLMAQMGQMQLQMMRMPEMAEATEEAFAAVDIAGYNYMIDRYELDKELYPNRVIVGSETFAKGIDKIWGIVKRNNHVIGDFTWTGWDYLGEAGIGQVKYNQQLDPRTAFEFYGNYPWLTAWTGDCDINGYRLPASYYREIVFGLRSQPYLAVQRPEHAGEAASPSPWSWSDVISSWSFPGFEGTLLEVEVYSGADEVELFINGRSLGRKTAGEEKGYRVKFEVEYEPGLIEAVNYLDGKVTGHYRIKSTDEEVFLDVKAENGTIQNTVGELAYVNIQLLDSKGVLHVRKDRSIHVSVDGSGELIGLGSAAMITEESYSGNQHTTFEGRALAIIRPTGTGTIDVSVSAEGCLEHNCEIVVYE